MGIYINDIEMPKSKPICIIIDPAGQVLHYDLYNDKYIGNELFEAVSIPPHGKLIDADEFLYRAIGTKCFDEDYARMLQELIGESITIIPAEEKKYELL